MKQDSTGSRAITFSTTITWADGSAPTFSTEANAIDIVTLFTYDGGTTWYGFVAGLDMGNSDSAGYDTTANAGYTILSNNIIVQWGQVDVPANSFTDFTFAYTFPNQCLQAVASGQEADPSETNSAAIGAYNFNTTHCSVFNNNDTTITSSVIAIGY